MEARYPRWGRYGPCSKFGESWNTCRPRAPSGEEAACTRSSSLRQRMLARIGRKNKKSPPHEPAEASARSGERRLEGLLGGPGLDGLQQGVVSEVGVPLGGLNAGVAEDLAHGEEINAAVDHERGRRVPEVVDPQARQPRHPDRPFPPMADGHEGLQGLRIRDQPRAALELGRALDDLNGGPGERDVT